ncbi:MAG: GNAT family N-acetyltransferase [Chloroflexota bacterium]|nr:GNAT family N-acetyltransferase [Chloroflexota bacterium]
MIYELDPNHYSVAAPLYRDAWERSAVENTLTRRRTDRCFVYTDDPEHPTSALVAHVGNYYMGGEPSESMLRFISDAPAETNAFAAGYYAFYAIREGWELALNRIAPIGTRSVWRRTFRREMAHAPNSTNERTNGTNPLHDLPDWRAMLPSGASVRLMDVRLAERVDRELDEQWIGSLWNDRNSDERYPARGYALFVEKSFGVAMLLHNRVVSTFWAFGVSDTAAAAEVETAAGYRGRGLATITGYAWLEACHARGVASEWIADADNDASNKLALRLGHDELRPVRKFIWRDWGMDINVRHGKWQREPHAAGWRWTRAT